MVGTLLVAVVVGSVRMPNGTGNVVTFGPFTMQRTATIPDTFVSFNFDWNKNVSAVDAWTNASFGWTLDLTQIVPFARWFPKNEKLSRVYDTRFYLADLGTGAVEVSIDHSENTKLFWTSAQGALDMAAAGDIKLIFPTRRNLERLALFASFEEARAQAEAIPVKTIVPQIDTSGAKPMLTIMQDAGYPITSELLETVARG